MIVNKLLYRISLNKARSWIMAFICNINAFSNLTSIIYLYNENMNLEMTIKKLGSAYKFRVGRATGNEYIFLFGLKYKYRPRDISSETPKSGNTTSSLRRDWFQH